MKKEDKISRFDVWKVKTDKLSFSDNHITKIIEVLLKNRGVKDKKEFFEPGTPFEISLAELRISESAVKSAVDRIIQAIDNKEKIIVYGDYDADGITATAVLWEALYNLQANAIPYIPNRFDEGYGINYESFLEIKKDHPDLALIITVDNGIVAVDDCNKIQKKGVDVIVTDHHQAGDNLPDVHSIVHTVDITGAGLAWILAREVYKEINEDMGILQKSLDLAAIGTIADIATLIGPNRSFVYHGIKELNKLERSGLASLAKISGVTPGQIAAYTVGYVLAPRLNAMGRLETAMDSLRLLCSNNKKRVETLAYKLNSTNKKRQEIVDQVVKHTLKDLKITKDSRSIVIAHETYHEGVIGLAASRLVEEYYLPAIVVSKGEKISKASARSISGFNIIEAIRRLSHLTEGGGGHPMAAGFSIKTENIDEFVREFEKIAVKKITDEIRDKVLNADIQVEFPQLSIDLAKELQKFDPTGPGNPAPSFLTENVVIKSMRPVGKDQNHLKFIFSQGKVFVDAIGFGFGDLKDSLKPGKVVDMVYNLEENRWNGNVSMQLKIKDVRYHESKT